MSTLDKELYALKEARKFRHEKEEHLVVIDIDYFNRCLVGIETALKVLEIIKELYLLDIWEDNGTYHLRPLYDIMKLSKEEYDLLKEVLL